MRLELREPEFRVGRKDYYWESEMERLADFLVLPVQGSSPRAGLLRESPYEDTDPLM
jgi:hypothetical protein